MIGEAEPQAAPAEATVAPVAAVPSRGPSPVTALGAGPGAMADFLALTDEDTRASTVLAMQRASGNRAVTRMLSREPVDAPARPVTAPPAPRMDPAPRGKIMALDNLELAKGAIEKNIGEDVDHQLLNVPIPQLGVRVGVGAHASFGLTFTGDYSVTLEHVQIGLSEGQIQRLWFEMSARHGVYLADKLRDVNRIAELTWLLGDFDGMATVVVPVNLALDAWMEGGLHAGAVVADAFEVAGLGTGLRASLTSSWNSVLRPHIELHYRDGKLDFGLQNTFEADFALLAKLESYLRASLLGYTWEKRWPLAKKQIDRHWQAAGTLDVGVNVPGRAALKIVERALKIADMLTALLEAADPTEKVEPEQRPGAPDAAAGTNVAAAPGGGGGPPSSGAGGAGPQLPTGRSPSDPIPMIWYKPPGLYPMSITVGGSRYWFTEPDWLTVPDEPRLSDIRRSAQTGPDGSYRVRIGVPVNSKFFPRLGTVWPRVRSGNVRTGTKQAQFRRLLAAQGFNWGSFEADHVRDLQWRGEDDYPNLWPLEESHNNAANRILEQPISYRTTGRQGSQDRVNVPLRTSDLNLYFEIVRFIP